MPTVAELREFTGSRDEDKKGKLVAKLLYDEQYTEEYARNWTTIWTNVLIGRSGGTERNSLTSREGMQKYLRDTFARNKPYDQMVLELVTATGATMAAEMMLSRSGPTETSASRSCCRSWSARGSRNATASRPKTIGDRAIVSDRPWSFTNE